MIPSSKKSLVSTFSGLIQESARVEEKNGVFVDSAWSLSGVTAQFIEEAGTYHERYFNRLDFSALIERCLFLSNVDRSSELKVLDIGSGSGSSVFPTCRLLPKAHIFATDISFQLLEMLAAFVKSKVELKDRVTIFCLDLHRAFFRKDYFDFVIGSAILHHLIDPYAALRNVANSLKPGGQIILIEPLEAGSLILTSVYEQVLMVLRRAGMMSSPIAKLMSALRLDIQARLGVPKVKPWTEYLDDKWVFDEPYLADLAKQLALSGVDVYPGQEDLTLVFETSFRSLLADSGNSDVLIPDEVWQVVREFDQGISNDLKRRLCPTGIIIFTK